MSRALLFLLFRGGTTRRAYFICGVALVAVKYNLDRLMAGLVFGREWAFWSYWQPHELYPLHRLPENERDFYFAMILLAMPFLWTGLVLTVRRLRDTGLPLPLVLLFFVPVINLVFFAFLSLAPSQPGPEERIPAGPGGRLGRFIPESGAGSATLGVAATAVLAVPAVWLSVSVFQHYGWGIFVAIPFVMGFLTVIVFTYHGERSLGNCLGLAVASVALAGLFLFLAAVEGLICLIMAAPIAAPIALFGGWLAWLVQYGRRRSEPLADQTCLLPLVIPVILFADARQTLPSPPMQVDSQMVIHAPIERVWDLVIDFPELDPPTDILFLSGIAYPMHAEIDGEGVGAIRECVFSTGPFIEPITHWDPPRHLGFAVTEQPAPMQEWSLYSHLRTLHLEGFLLTEHGEFRLETLPDGSTLLTGITWYSNEIRPVAYWRLWSDWIISRIHHRVLNHIRREAEAGGSGAG